TRPATSSSPCFRRAEVIDSALGYPDDQRIALSAATAQGRGADSAPATAEFQREVQGDPGAAHADRVSESDRAPVDVDVGLVDAELTGAGDADRGERLVDLDQVEVRGQDALLRAGLGDRVGGLHL